MIDIDSVFKNKRLDAEKLTAHGFILSGGTFTKDFPIMGGKYMARVSVPASGGADIKVYDAESRDEYVLARVRGASGPFVGEIHRECENILNDISETCFSEEYFSWEQSKRILDRIKTAYGAVPEFLWKNLPECAALRVPGKKPWFAVIGRVDKSKLGLDGSGTAEVINLKDEPETVKARINAKLVLPAYHMNKQHWYTVVLDDCIPDEKIMSMVRTSFELVND